MAELATSRAAVHTRRATAPDPESAILDALRELVALNRAILAALEKQQRPSHLTREDRGRLAAILPALVGVKGTDWFTARELIQDRSPALRLVLDELNAVKLGRLLQRAEGAIVDGYGVERGGLEVGAILWRVFPTT